MGKHICHVCKDLYSWKRATFPGKEDCSLISGQPQATTPPMYAGCAPVGLKADRCSAFLVNFVIIGEDICQHILTEHKRSI